MTKVNFDFIAELEGGPVLRGYVPDPEYSKSGVTIATGFDLGQCSEDDLIKLLPEGCELVNTLAPYCLLKKNKAVAALQAAPLRITSDDAHTIDQCVKQQKLAQLVERYNRASELFFEQLPEPVQTVIASVAFQYGDLAKRCPLFWKAAIAGNTAAMVAELTNFGDRYPSRRRCEAKYLTGAV